MSAKNYEFVEHITCDIVIYGGSMGACAAVIASQNLETDLDVVLVHQADWIGGQMTSQGVSALDEHAYIETFGATQQYLALRDAIRQHYIKTVNAPVIMTNSVLGSDMPLNPGNGWVSRLCFKPDIALNILQDQITTRMIQGHIQTADVSLSEHRIHQIVVTINDKQAIRIDATYFLDASDTGDLLPVTGTAYVSGAESNAMTDEPHATSDYRPSEVQGFTYSFAVEYCEGEDHTIEKPTHYDAFRQQQPYTTHPIARDGTQLIYHMFKNSEQGYLPFWTYRRIHDGKLLGGNDIALINWGSNDYYGGDILNASDTERKKYLREAKNLSLGFLYWLQTDCPRDDGGKGYPEMKLRPDIMGTDDGLTQQPYIRESRRIVPVQRVIEQDISATFNAGARAKQMTDSMGIGWYAMDLHSCVGNPDVHLYAPTKPFQIPLSAIVPQMMQNLLPACKNIGTTHLTNGAYRLHPIEWAIGEAAGHLAHFCMRHHVTPHAVSADEWLIWRLQYQLVRYGCPIAWAVDVPIEHPQFMITQLLLVKDILIAGHQRWHSLEIGMNQPLEDDVNLDTLQALAHTINAFKVASPIDTTRINSTITWYTLCNLFESAVFEVLQ